jgi:hypothetical protein
VVTRLFSDAHLERLRSFPDIDRDQLIRFVTLTPADADHCEQVAVERRDHRGRQYRAEPAVVEPVTTYGQRPAATIDDVDDHAPCLVRHLGTNCFDQRACGSDGVRQGIQDGWEACQLCGQCCRIRHVSSPMSQNGFE